MYFCVTEPSIRTTEKKKKKKLFIPKLALPSTREKMTFSYINDTLLPAKISVNFDLDQS